MTLRNLFCASICIGAALAAPAQTSQKITAGKANEYGLVYSLPATALDVYIEAEISESHPGEFIIMPAACSVYPTPSHPTLTRQR